MTFDMTHGKDPLYQVHIYGWNVDDKYLFCDYITTRSMDDNFISTYGLCKSDKPIITISDVITSERINHEAEAIS